MNIWDFNPLNSPLKKRSPATDGDKTTCILTKSTLRPHILYQIQTVQICAKKENIIFPIPNLYNKVLSLNVHIPVKFWKNYLIFGLQAVKTMYYQCSKGYLSVGICHGITTRQSYSLFLLESNKMLTVPLWGHTRNAPWDCIRYKLYKLVLQHMDFEVMTKKTDIL